jgi:hypothetical protein
MLEYDLTYKSFHAMRQRCFDLKHPMSRRHGQRGIIVCKRWLGPKGFENFRRDMGERPEGLTLERIDNDGNYTPSNCRWATRKEQSRNRSDNKLTAAQVRRIRSSRSPQKRIAAHYGICASYVSMIRSRKRWN